MREELLKSIIAKYGCINRLDMMIKMCANLTKTISNFKLSNQITNEGINKPTIDSSIEYSLDYNMLCSDVVNLKLMLAEMMLILDKETIDLIFERRLDSMQQTLNDK